MRFFPCFDWLPKQSQSYAPLKGFGYAESWRLRTKARQNTLCNMFVYPSNVPTKKPFPFVLTILWVTVTYVGSAMDNLNTLPMTVEEPVNSTAMCIHGAVINLDTQEMADPSASSPVPAASSVGAPMEPKSMDPPAMDAQKSLHPPMETEKGEHPPMETKKAEHPAIKKTEHPPMETEKTEHPTMETEKAEQPPMKAEKTEHSPMETEKTEHPAMQTEKLEPNTEKATGAPMETSAEIPVPKGGDSKPEASQALQSEGAGKPTEPKGVDQDVKSLMELEEGG